MDIFWAKSWKIGQNHFFGRGFFFAKKVGYQQNRICFYMPWEPLGKWAKLNSNFHQLSPPSLINGDGDTAQNSETEEG